MSDVKQAAEKEETEKGKQTAAHEKMTCTNTPNPVNPILNFYYEQQIKGELKRIHISGCRCNEKLKAKTDGSKRLTYTGFLGDLEHLTMETRLIGESFECGMGECVIQKLQVSNQY